MGMCRTEHCLRGQECDGDHCSREEDDTHESPKTSGRDHRRRELSVSFPSLHWLSGSQEDHLIIRTAICQEADDDEYIKETGMDKAGVWGTDREIMTFAKLMKCCVAVFSMFGRENVWQHHN